MSRLVVVSNRVATPTETKGSAGGLAVGVFGALKDSGGVWFGWSGDVVSESVANSGPTLDEDGAVTFATVGLPKKDYDQYYRGFSNATLWPVFHYRNDLAVYDRDEYAGYRRVNAWLAHKRDQAAATRRRHLGPRLSPDSVRRSAALRGRDEPHRVFPAHSVSVAADPAQHSAASRNWSKSLCCYDVVGFQTARRPARVSRLHRASRARHRDAPTATSRRSDASCKTGVYRIGVFPDEIAEQAKRGEARQDVLDLKQSLRRPQADHERRPARLFEGAGRALPGVRAFAGDSRRSGAATSRSCRSRRRRARTWIPTSRSARTSNTKRGASTAAIRDSTTRRSAI